MKRKSRKAQVSVEYLVIVGFVTLVVIGILGVAFFYSGTIKDKIKITQVNNFANKITSTAESVFYAGEPSKATITIYLPEGVKEIEVNDAEDSLIISIQTSSGLNKISFSSKVPISNSTSLSVSKGLKKIEITAEESQVTIGMG